VLHEMATGQKPFRGDTNVSVISAIIKDTPALDLRNELEELKQDTASGPIVSPDGKTLYLPGDAGWASTADADVSGRSALFMPDGGMAIVQRIQGRSVVSVRSAGDKTFRHVTPPTTDFILAGADREGRPDRLLARHVYQRRRPDQSQIAGGHRFSAGRCGADVGHRFSGALCGAAEAARPTRRRIFRGSAPPPRPAR
jgi:hypothetical protein